MRSRYLLFGSYIKTSWSLLQDLLRYEIYYVDLLNPNNSFTLWNHLRLDIFLIACSTFFKETGTNYSRKERNNKAVK